MTVYAELATASAFSFLHGASHAEELVETAAALGLAGLGLADRNTVAGVVRAHEAAKRTGLRLAVGARLVFRDGTPDILCYPEDRAAWGRLTRLLTAGKLRAGPGQCALDRADLIEHGAGSVLIVLPAAMPEIGMLRQLAAAFPAAVHLAAHRRYQADDAARLRALADLAAAARTPLVAVNDVLYHAPARRPLQDVLTCIRAGCRIEEAGFRLAANAERHLKPPGEMARLFAAHPAALTRTTEILARCRFSLDDLTYEYPDEPVPPGRTPDAHLADLAWQGAARRFPHGMPAAVRETLAKELRVVAALNYARYFLTVHDIVAFARGAGILCQGRGSAANSVLCYCLGITAVDPTEIDLLFERFVSAERREPPDIDVDFEHERREEVIQYIYRRYGRHRAGIAATVIHYRPKLAIREVGKVFGLAEDATAALATQSWHAGDELWPDARVREVGLDPGSVPVRHAVALARELVGFPRHLSQHVGGFVLTRGRLDETVPIGPAAMAERSFIEWDKDDIDALGLMKVDVLALGMLTCIRKAFALIGLDDLAAVPREDGAVYAMLSRGDSVGVFQVESRAQMNMLPRLLPREFYDLVIEVAIVRPGPIQGDMVHPYLRRRQGKEAVAFASPAPEHGPPDELVRVLGRTLGVPLFQEQAMRIAMVAARFTPEEANRLRRAMATFRHVGTIHTFAVKMIEGMVARGYPRDFAERCFRQIEGFGTYGFPESHAASFAHLVYVSAWLKCHHPAAFACALLNSQPMGFYAPAQIVRDARAHGAGVRGVDVNASAWDCTLEAGALRLGLRLLDGFRADWAARLCAARGNGFANFAALAAATLVNQGLPRAALEALAEADAMRSLGLDRRAALWQVRGLSGQAALPLFAALPEAVRPARLPEMKLAEHVLADYRTQGLSLKSHPMRFLRAELAREGMRSCAEVMQAPHGTALRVAGLVLVRQRPGSAAGVVFLTIEDESGVANIVVWPTLVERCRRAIVAARILEVAGRVQRSEEGIVHVIAEHLHDRNAALHGLAGKAMARADELPRPRHFH